MNEPTFLFYDLETTGLNRPYDRIMQFAAQRTNMKLEPIGDPFNIVVALTDEILPNPQAILTTGITPQYSRREGITEAEFVKRVHAEAFTPGTIVVGFNSVRFDDDFMRFCFYRNFYDPYEWSWLDGRSRWDLLDCIRMTRALRPEGIEWPVSKDGKPVNKLELITQLNGISHEQAHDALSDVTATIEVARILRDKQPDLFNFLLKLRDKKEVAKIVDINNPKPFVYSSGSFGSEFEFTSVCVPFGLPDSQGRIKVYDLRYDPTEFTDLSESDLKKKLHAPWEERKAEGFVRFPAKQVALNKCPAVAPIGVLRHEDQERIQLDIETIQRHWELFKSSGLDEKLSVSMGREEFPKSEDVDLALYDGFFGPGDKSEIMAVRNATKLTIGRLAPRFSDPRLPELFLRYKARNMPEALTEAEMAEWQAYRVKRIVADLPAFSSSMEKCADNASERELSLLEDLKLWAQSIIPEAD